MVTDCMVLPLLFLRYVYHHAKIFLFVYRKTGSSEIVNEFIDSCFVGCFRKSATKAKVRGLRYATVNNFFSLSGEFTSQKIYKCESGPVVFLLLSGCVPLKNVLLLSIWCLLAYKNLLVRFLESKCSEGWSDWPQAHTLSLRKSCSVTVSTLC